MDSKKKSENMSEEQWREKLTEEQYKILRQKGTDQPFNNKYNDNHKSGEYYCAGCGDRLFDSAEKYDSGSGWPSFTAPVTDDAIEQVEDSSLGMRRVEIICAKCGGHLGHVFDDGPQPTNLRYCINSTSLDFKERGTD